MAKKVVQEAGGSMNDVIRKIDDAFYAWLEMAGKSGWVMDVFENEVVICVGGFGAANKKYYRVGYSMDDDGMVIFADKDTWQEVMLDWSAVGAEMPETTEGDEMEEGDDENEVSESFRGLVEAAKGGGFDAVIIVEGLSANGNFYTKEALESGAAVFSGAKMFVDHPTRSEESDRPERSVRDLVARLGEAYMGTDKNGRPALKAPITFSETAGWLKTLVAEGIADGLSIRAYGKGKQGKDGHFVVEAFNPSPRTSVDFVTVAAAGGYATLTESARGSFWDGITADEIKKHRPDLIEAENGQEVKALVESDAGVVKLQEAYDALLAEVDTLRRERMEASLKASGLPQAAQERIKEGWNGSDDVGQLIEAERVYLAKVAQHGAVVGAGRQNLSEAKAQQAEAMLAEAFRDLLGGNEEAAKIAVKGRD